MKDNIIDVITVESKPEPISVSIDNIANFYSKKEVYLINGKEFITYSCIDLKKPVNNQFETLHCVESYSVLSSYIKTRRCQYLTRAEGRLYFYMLLILFPLIELVRVIVYFIGR